VVTDDSELAGLDPFGLLDREAARLEAHFSSLADAAWARPSRCEGWSVRDVLAHLLAVEDYHHACLDGTVAAFEEQVVAKGGTDLQRANAIGIARFAGRTPAELLTEWQTASAETRRGFRERDDGTVDTSVGEYPGRWQAFHVASELATHADDVGVPVTAEERDGRVAWRARVSRFALAEDKPDVTISVEGGRTRVRGGDIEVEVDDEAVVEGVAGRLDESSGLDEPARELLSAMP
jgi:uncharacterized protein (TIGR03083 family)